MNHNINKTFSAKAEDINRKWYIVDAENKVLGRLAVEVAKVLRGKNKPEFTPHVDTGDFVIVINADKVDLTGQKFDQKYYLRYTGYMGGQKKTTLKEMLKKHPTRVVEHAVKGMIPKNKLGRQVFKKLKVYAGTVHPHEAQKPEKLEI